MLGKLLEKLKKYWEDPVWSKVIAGIILAIVIPTGIVIWAFLQNIFSKIPFKDTFNSVYYFLLEEIQLPIWVLFLSITILIAALVKPTIGFSKKIFQGFNKSNEKQSKEISLPKAKDHSTVFFHYRMSKAFPGVRGLKVFEKPKEAIHRLEILLEDPLKFESEISGYEPDPIWWFRGYSALFILTFKRLLSRKVLMNSDQLKIKKIIAFHDSGLYYKNFVYVEVEKEKQTGLYNFSKEDIERHIENRGYSNEEYGLIKHLKFWKRPIRREDYDDGATVINDKVVNAGNAELRTRYLSKYNFLIAAKGSPYNSTKFSIESKAYFDNLLRGTIEFDEFFEYLNAFEKKEYRR